MRCVLIILGALTVASPAVGDENPLTALRDRAGKDPGALTSVGNLYLEAALLKEAETAFKQALKLDAKYQEAKLGLAEVEIQKGRFNQAKQACKAVANRSKQDSDGSICLGRFWLSNNRAARAEEEFQNAIQLGDLKRGKAGMGDVFMQQGDLEKALSAFNEAIDTGARFKAHIGRGLALELKGDKGEAAKAFSKALSMEPASCLANYHLGRLMKPGEEAVQYLKTALLIRPNWPDALIAMGAVYFKLNNLKAAKEAYRAAAQAAPGRSDALLGLGRALNETGETAEALEILKKTVELVPNYPQAYLLMAEIQIKTKEIDAALASLEKAAQTTSNDVDVFFYSGKMYFDVGRDTMARSFLNKALAINPKLSRAYFILGQISCKRRLYDEGKGYLKLALEGDLEGVERAEIQKAVASCTQ